MRFILIYVCNRPFSPLCNNVFTQVAKFAAGITTLISQALTYIKTSANKTANIDATMKPMAVDAWPVPGRELGSGAFGVVLEGTMADGRKVCTTWLMAACMHTVDTRTWLLACTL
jgi:hypothetical protein